MSFVFNFMSTKMFQMLPPVFIHENQSPIAWLVTFFLLVAIFIVFKVCGVFDDYKTDKLGIETIGLIVETKLFAKRHNGEIAIDATIVVVKDGNVEKYTERLFDEHSLLKVGDYVDVKCYRNDINVIRKTNMNNVSESDLELLKQYSENIESKHNI